MTYDSEYVTLSVIGNFAGTVFSCSERVNAEELDENGDLMIQIFETLETDMLEKAHAKGMTGTPEIQQNVRIERDIDRINTWKSENNTKAPCIFCNETTCYRHNDGTPVCNECVNIYGTTDITDISTRHGRVL